MDSRELVWRYVMDQAKRLTGGISGYHDVSILGNEVAVIVTNNEPVGTSYLVSNPKLFGWFIDGKLERPFVPRIHAKGKQATYDLLAKKVQHDTHRST